MKVITYGTFDQLHYGHIRLLERAKALGDYLIVGVTSDNYDRNRGKINVKQSLMERVEAVKELNIADKIIVEEYEGQKIDDIKHYEIDIFTVGSDWIGKFDYLKQYCKVIYLDRTEGVSSTQIRSNQKRIKMGLVGDDIYLAKFFRESRFVNGLEIAVLCTNLSPDVFVKEDEEEIFVTSDYEEMLEKVDAVYIHANPGAHYELTQKALLSGKDVLCEAPISLTVSQYNELIMLAKINGRILMDSIRTAFSTAYERLLLLLKSGIIGDIKMIDVTCTSLKDYSMLNGWNSICAWGPNAMLPVFQILGTNYKGKAITSMIDNNNPEYDMFTKIDFRYSHALATIKVGQGVKSEGEMIISGTEGYVFVPSPWWKTDYFEVRFENPENNKRYFYPLEGEGIRYELVTFRNAIVNQRVYKCINPEVSRSFVSVIQDFYNKKDYYDI